MTDAEAISALRKALHGYMFAMTSRTQSLAHREAEKVMRDTSANDIRAKQPT